ncbi:TetR/AcrR family transcriptional regulator [Chengkuizengella sp. SCS-71B]|uniref:TetR/AcrR family transcriptional regulator n=1 Tax=Chengkuizengella sp. SCS-71B TaxID=3115290 RepID=UPI0032C240AA
MSSTKEKIIQASLDLFADYGHKVTTVKMIAEKLDLNELTIYRHFGSKEKIIEEVIHMIPRFEPRIVEFFLNQVVYDLETDLRSFAKLIIDTSQDNYIFLKLLINNLDLKERNYMNKSDRDRVKEAFHHYFKQMETMGKVISLDMVSLSLLLYSTVEGAFLLIDKFGDSEVQDINWELYIESWVKLFVKGLEVR